MLVLNTTSPQRPPSAPNAVPEKTVPSSSASIADLTLIDPEKRWTVDPATFRSRSHNTPFASMAMRGKALAVCLAGRVVDGDLDGRFTR